MNRHRYNMRSKALHILSILLLSVGLVTTARAQSKIKILGNVYGGGDQAAVQGNTYIEINKGLYGGEIFGGGNGALNGDGTVNKSADVNTTTVTINGGKFIVEQETTGTEAGKLTNNHNVFGGGNLACQVFGNTNVEINAGLLPTEFFAVEGEGPSATSMYRKWGEYVGRIEGMTAAKAPDTPEKLVQGSVFGAGYGVHTDVAGTANVTIAIGDEEAIDETDDILKRYAYAKRGGDITGEHLASKFVISAFGGGYDGKAENTNVQISGSPFLQNVFGGGLGSKAGAKQKNPSAAYASTVGTVNGGTNVNITGATIYGNVYGGGAGIFGEIEATTAHGTARMPYYKAAMVMKETNLEISGGTLIFGNVYGGGDIANTGWFEEGYRPSELHQNYVNESQAHLDLTTYLQMKGGNVMGNVFAGGNGRKMTELEKANFIGAIIGNTSVVLGNWNGASWDAGTKIWGSVYGGGQNGSIYSCEAMATNNGGTARTLASGLIDGCTNVEFKHTDIGQDIFGGGLGAVEMVDHDHNPATPEQEIITSADISGNTFVFFNRGNLITGKYWDPQDCVFKEQRCGIVDAVDYRDTQSDIAHNLYGGGNMACTIGTKINGNLVAGTGNATVYMIGAPVVDPSFMGSKYYTDALDIYGKPHFSAFGAGYGKYAKVLGNAYSDIALVAAGFHSVVGGGMNGPVEGECYTHIACDKDNTLIHNVYGGGYYAPVGGTHLQITEGHILENVFGGGVMGNIAPDNEDMTAAVASTVIGLKKEGDGSSYTLYGVDGESEIRTYNYDGNKIIIDGNVYGGNDVSGTVNGVASLTLYGGMVKSNVHGAGNGNHVGYYVPGILKYDKGEHGDDNYFMVDHTAHGGPEGKTYVGRPQTIGGVELTLEGNTTDERVKVLGQVFGGGNSCTIGAWNKTLLTTTYAGNPHLVRDDPAYFLGGGTLDINLGSHVTIGRTHKQLSEDADGSTYIDNGENVSGLFMGCSGRDLATQTGVYDEDNYYHHYFDYNAKQYYPGFAVGSEAGTPMSREGQLKPFQAYLNNIIVWSDSVRLNIKNQDGTDANDIWLANFVGGGFRGSMRTKEITGKFDYSLPEGVTIGHTIVGGAYNAHVQYHYFDTDNDGKFVDGNSDGVYDYATSIPAGWEEGVDYVRLEYSDDEHQDDEHIKSIIRYNFNGGILSENSTGVNASPVGHHIHQVHADPRATKDKDGNDLTPDQIKERYATSYFEPLNASDPGAASEQKDKLFTANKGKVLLHLDLQCAMEPEVLTDTKGTYLHGGNVFGGCFLSGFVEGDSWVDYNCWLSPTCSESTDPKMKYYFNKENNMTIYDVAMDVERNNALNAYGAGYGTDTHSMGDVYLSIKAIEQNAGGDGNMHGHFPYMFNAFGGSNMGEVDGNVNVYYAVGKQGTLLGSLYGGGFKGVINGNTFVELAEGFVNNVYGGSRQADIMGAAHVWAYDGAARGITNANHLIICNLYGGNDIAGIIHGTMPAYFTESKWTNTREPIVGKTFNTYVEISADDESADRGFPLVGSAFAGGNGEAWVSEVESGAKPNVAKALIEIGGGSTLRAFGGGNMATVTDSTFIFTNAESTHFADVEFTQYQKNIVQNIFFRDVTVGYKWEDSRLTMDNFHVARLFGGNNLATMDIQPTWNLKNGRLENVYSGGNMGDMTYYNPAGKPATQNGAIGESAGVENNADGSNANYLPRGLSITIDQPDIYIGSLFGGCRLSDVRPNDDDYDDTDKWPTGADGEDFYGATVNILDGYIENVYGGNDISGEVHHGTNVNISGAVSGNVYGSGNGFYLYKWDKDIDWDNKDADVIEEFNGELKELVYHVKPTGDKAGWDTASDTKKLLTINDYRPSVEKAFLNIAGISPKDAAGIPGQDGYSPAVPKKIAYVKGNVYCGGNASTIIGDASFTKFKIGSYVTLNGVFMGSDGKAYTENDQIAKFADLNGFTDMGATTSKVDFPDYDSGTGLSVDQSHNPILLNVYMMAVDMKAQPKDFNLNLPLKEAHIGTYCGGGNRGSMLVDKTVELPFHHDIIIYDKIVAACLDANVEFNDGTKKIYSMGGYTRKITDNATYGNKKFKLDIASQFVPLVMDVPADKNPETKNSHDENFEEAMAHGFLYDNRQKGVKYSYEEFNKLFETNYVSDEEFLEHEGGDHIWKIADGVYAPSCNIYGGCYQSGEVEGDIELNIYSNMLRYVNKEALDKSIANNIPCFNVYGAGFGQNSHVWGNVTINMDRCLDTSTMGTIGSTTVSDELAELLGAPHGTHASEEVANWDILHNTTAAHNFLGITNANTYPSFNNVIGGGRNGKLIGNTTVEIRNGLVYTDVAGGCYASDMYGSTQVIVGYPKYYRCKVSGEYALDRADKWNTEKLDGDGHAVIKQSVWYLKGDLVPDNVYQQIIAKTPGNTSNFEEVIVTPTTKHPTDGTTWNDVAIKIGKGIYGGGYSLENSMAASAGSVTTWKLLDDAATTTDINPHNFSGRYGYDEPTFAGYGGNSCVMLGDQEGGEHDHIRVSTLKATVASIPATSSVIGKFVRESDGRYTHQGDKNPDPHETYYTLTGDGGIYGDGHLTFCEGFRAADVSRYGWADGTAKHPILMNTFQRMDLLSVNDCCLMLQGAQDFATDQIDATIYSITRINEMRLNSSLDADGTLGQISAYSGSGEGAAFDTKKQRNYLAFFNNVHYLGSIVTNDAFTDGFHNNQGAKTSDTYFSKKLGFIEDYTNSTPDANGKKTAAATTEFKQRNVGTARNAIGINNGYCLRIQNQEYVGAHQSQTYYGPIVGVCEVKLLTLVQGEGGGYVYADNIHEYTGEPGGEDHFLMTSGNFVFPGIIDQGNDPITNEPIGNQYIVDDCFVQHFGSPGNITTRDNSHDLDEAHYWYVEGNKYFFTTTLTGFTYKNKLDFDLIKTDPNVVLSGMENGSSLNIKKIEWLSTHRNNYDPVLPSTAKETDAGGNEIDKISDYEFDIFVGGNDITDWHSDMPRYSAPASGSFTTGKTVQNDHLPQFNIRLQDKLDNSGDAAYKNHLDEPELVKIYFEGKTTDSNGVEQTYEYTITVNIVYLQGPTVTGGVKIENCALPGELIGFSTSGLKVKTPELMPITAASWQILPLSEIDEHGEWKWDTEHGIVIPDSRYSEDPETQDVIGTIRALYKQNEYTIAYIFTAGGYDFPVMPEQNLTTSKENRMIVVHNYHRMKEVVTQDLQIETMPSTIPDHSTGSYHPKFAEAKLYIEDETDLKAFINYLNMATEDNTLNIPVGLTGLDIILQNDIKLTNALPTISQTFAGTFHGDGYHIDLNGNGTSFLGNSLTGKVYNLGLVGGTISSVDTKDANGLVNGTNTFNSYEFASSDDFADGSLTYNLSHHFVPDTDGYVEGRYVNGDYQYATTDRVWSLRTGAPNYGHEETRHDTHHTHDAARWKDTDNDGEADSNVPLYNGTLTFNDKTVDISGNGTEYFTYRGLPAGYANDYLFFGQHLDKTNADAYPVHIDGVSNSGNRVFKTAGYYQSKEDKQFYYNKDAWALKPTLTAVDYTNMTAEGDNAITLPTKFSVDSNKDYAGVPYDNATVGHVTQNLLVYNGGQGVFAAGSYPDSTAESAIAYHSIANGSTDYFHLVDKQDFNAPIAFNVNTRAWYERLPKSYRNLVDKDGDGTVDYNSSSAWEGIVLPFTATKVTAEKNGEITHFYGETEGGDHTLHHEYWLTGMVAADGDKATFARPADSGDDLFVEDKQTAAKHDYLYQANDYFTSLFNYNGNYDTRDDEGDDTMGNHDQAWYAMEHTFTNYVPLTAEVPYIVAFPGDDFYEFSMESYYKTDTYGKEVYSQKATFESGATTIKVSDGNSVSTTVEGEGTTHKHIGTYMHETETGKYGMNDNGSAFVSGQEILPFRTYMTISSPSSPVHSIRISDVVAQMDGSEPGDNDEELDSEVLRIWSEGQEIVVDTPVAVDLNVYTSNGIMHAVLHCKEGINRFLMDSTGLYFVGKVKLLLK